MNNKHEIDKMPKEMLLASRKLFLGLIDSGRLGEDSVDELRELISYIESKLKNDNVSLSTPVSQADMEKAQKYMGGFSGISNSNINYNDYKKELDGNDIIGGIIVGAVALVIISSFFSWLGGVISNLWTSGIIPGILGALGLGGVGVGIYKLYENGFFDKINNYFEEKKIEKSKKKKYKQSISKVKEREKANSKETEEEKGNLLGTIGQFVKDVFVSYTMCAILATVGYHIVDKNELNGQKLSFKKVGNLEDKQYRPQQEFNANWEVLKNSYICKDIMYDIPEDRKWNEPNHYSLDIEELEKFMVYPHINDISMYIRFGYVYENPTYYHFDKALCPFLDIYDKELVEIFNDYQNAIIYYASNDMRQELYDALNAFYIDCHLLFLEEKTYQLGNPICMFSYKFDDASNLAKIVSLSICNNLLKISYMKEPEFYCYSEKLSRGYLINLREIEDFVQSELEIAKHRDKNKQYVKY